MQLDALFSQINQLNDDLFELAEGNHWQAFAEQKTTRDALLVSVFQLAQAEPEERWLVQTESLSRRERELIALCQLKQQELQDEIQRLAKQKALHQRFIFE